jgi:hypothetical protein
MNYKIGVCKSCGYEKLIVNKTHGLCQTCNKKRLASQSPQKHSEGTSKKKSIRPYKAKKMSYSANKRAKAEALYEKNKRDKKQWLIDNKKYQCFFCNAKLIPEDESVSCHHILGRTGDLLFEWDNLSFAHTGCHMDYHRKDADHLVKLKWYHYFLDRIRVIAELSGNDVFVKLYNKEILRLHKAGIYDEEIYFEKLLP